jgi:uncharacterized protein with HEPN domain
MSPRDDGLCVGQMLEYARAIEQELSNVSREQFDRDARLRRSIVALVQNIGEAARNVSRSFKDAHPEIEWREIVGMRHELVHGYDRIDFDEVWSTATIDIPHLITSLSNLLP